MERRGAGRCAGSTGPLARGHLATRRTGRHGRRRTGAAYLADDLDTPKAIAALDGWSTDAFEYGGHDIEAPRTVATAVDALLGVAL